MAPTAQERPGAAALLDHPFVQFYTGSLVSGPSRPNSEDAMDPLEANSSTALPSSPIGPANPVLENLGPGDSIKSHSTNIDAIK